MTSINLPAFFPECRSLIGYATTIDLNIRVFLSKNYGLIPAPQKADVLKTKMFARSEASTANMLVSRTSNFQGANISP